jgi:uncharacterized membrane protein YphA (DoxX/SURF4 family)
MTETAPNPFLRSSEWWERKLVEYVHSPEYARGCRRKGNKLAPQYIIPLAFFFLIVAAMVLICAGIMFLFGVPVEIAAGLIVAISIITAFLPSRIIYLVFVYLLVRPHWMGFLKYASRELGCESLNDEE